MNLNTLAFFTGLFGSLHCIAMCGPLVMSLPLAGTSAWYSFIQRLLYQLGRILTYSCFGILFGWIGQGFNLLGWQQIISLCTGIILVLIAFAHFTKRNITVIERFQLKLIGPLSNCMGKLLGKPYGGFLAGMLNGILPCGMVYLALAGAVNANSIAAGAEYMFYFGLGTTPLMLMASVAGMFFRRWAQLRFSKVLPYLTLFMGIWFILRGADLAIPYLSPHIQVTDQAICD
jgi:sulfite exporter TauE/SafE